MFVTTQYFIHKANSGFQCFSTLSADRARNSGRRMEPKLLQGSIKEEAPERPPQQQSPAAHKARSSPPACDAAKTTRPSSKGRQQHTFPPNINKIFSRGENSAAECEKTKDVYFERKNNSICARQRGGGSRSRPAAGARRGWFVLKCFYRGGVWELD